MAHLTTNIGTQERLLSVCGGAYLLYRTFAKERTGLLPTIAGTYLLLRGMTGFCLGYDLLGKNRVDFRAPNINIRTSLRVNRPRVQVYAFWRRLENLPQFMGHLKSVTLIDDTRSQWTATLPGEIGTVAWTSEIVKDDPGATLSWHSLPGSSIENAGKITFTDFGTSGTEVRIVFSYHAPLGVVGERAGRLFTPALKTMVEEDIRNFKRHIEQTVATSAGRHQYINRSNR